MIYGSYLVLISFLITPVLLEDSAATDPSQTPDANYFLDYIFNKYGNNGKISYEGFEHLLDSLGLGRLKFNKDHLLEQHKSENGTFEEVHDKLHLHEHNHVYQERAQRSIRSARSPVNRNQLSKRYVAHNGVKLGRNNCLTPEEMLIIYNFEPNHELGLSPLNFMHICPVLVYQLEQRSCRPPEETSKDLKSNSNNTFYIWMSATFSVMIISVVGLLGVCIVPLLQKTFFSEILSFLVALAVGTLCGDALLHLLPHVLERHNDENPTNVILRAGVVFLSIVAFFIIESTMHSHEEEESMERTDIELATKTSKDAETGHMLSHSHAHSHAIPKKGMASVAYMVIMGDGLHNLTDGLAIGAAFSGDLISGFTTAIAVFTHELPHELGDFAVLLKVGMTVKEAIYYNVLSSVLSFLGMAIGLFLGNFSSASLWIYAITAGVFLYIALVNLVPEIKKPTDGHYTNLILQLGGLLTGAGIMFLIAVFEHDLENIILN